jgi:acyl-CoA synthetase (NDP forming)
VAVPASVVPGVLEDCVVAGTKNVHVFSSGFSETGEEEGRKLEQQVIEITRNGGLNLVGPNCFGIYVPASKLAYWGAYPTGSGSVAFISQSGGHGEELSEYAQGLGIHFSKIISFGNACGLQVIDFLEYLAQDEDTKIVTMYLEGIKDGNKVTQLIRDINRIKPVIVWKGGLTDSGARAVASHTGSLAGESRIWQAFFAQTGAIRVHSLEEMVDVVMALQYLQVPQGRRCLLFGGGGGNAVAMADIFNEQELDVPPISAETRKELASFIPLAGNSLRNPLDLWPVLDNIELLRRCMELVVADPVVDMVVLDRHPSLWGDDDRTKLQNEINQYIINFAKTNKYNKPVVVAMRMLEHDPDVIAAGAKQRRDFSLAGVPAYSSPAMAARALGRFARYHELLSDKG